MVLKSKIAPRGNKNNDIQLAASEAIKEIANAAGQATKLIADSAGDASKLIATSAGDAVKVLANATNEASKVVANNAAEALKVSTATSSCDHDLLIRLETKMTGLKEDIKDIKDGTSTKISDHETRINTLETSKTRQTTLLTIGAALILVLASMLIYHLFQIGI